MLLGRDPDLMGWRERGVAIHVTPGMVIMRIMVPRPYRWVPAFGDLVAMDWQTGTQAQFVAKYAARPAEA